MICIEAGEQFSGVDPLVDECLQLVVVSKLLADGRQAWLADEASGALAFPGPTELEVGSVLLGRVRLASTARIAADVVLLGQMTWPQIAQRIQLLLDALDAAFQCSDTC